MLLLHPHHLAPDIFGGLNAIPSTDMRRAAQATFPLPRDERSLKGSNCPRIALVLAHVAFSRWERPPNSRLLSPRKARLGRIPLGMPGTIDA